MYRPLLLVFLLLSATATRAQIHFFPFVDSLFARPEIQTSTLLKNNLQNAGYRFTGDVDLDRKVMKLLYMHMLITSYFAVDGDSSGGFQIPYFWNYTNHNPRENIVLIKKNKTLKELPPAPGHGSYATLATQDRVPTVFWGDYCTNEPKYRWEHLNGFYSYGWCSEREMAFKAWLGVVGIKSVIGIKDIHVWAEVYLPEIPDHFIFIDNTFDRFEVRPMSQRYVMDPKERYIKWYNSVPADPVTLKRLADLKVSPQRAKQIEELVLHFFTANKDDY